MHKLIKLLAPLIIICLLVPLCIGQDRIKTKIALSPESGLIFENYFGIETPTIGQKFKLSIETKYNDQPVEYVKITHTNGFKLLDGPKVKINGRSSKVYAYTLKAPDKKGSYKINFESRVGNEQIITYDTQIKVVHDDPKQNWLRAAIWGGISFAVLGVALIASSMSK